jgi:hypothetical protein
MLKRNSKRGKQPVAEKNLDGYGAPLIPWSRVCERLEQAFTRSPGSGTARVLAGNGTPGRQLGLSAGGSLDAIAAFGDPKRTPAESYTAFEDALHILRGMRANTGKSFTYPVHRIPIWASVRPQMLRLTAGCSSPCLTCCRKLCCESTG